MKILVTGTEGYIGARLAPILAQRAATTSPGSTPASTATAASTSIRSGMPTAPRTVFKDLRTVDADGLRGLRRRRPSGRAVERSARRRTGRRSRSRSTTRARCASRRPRASAGVRRFVYASSCSVYGVGSGGSSSTRPRRPIRRPPTRSARCSSSATSRRWPTPTSASTFLRNATAYGPSPRMRFDIVLNDLCALAWTRQEDRDGRATAARGGRSCTSRTSARPCAARSRRRPMPSTARSSTSAHTTENYRVREIAAHRRRGLSRAARSPPARRARDNRSYRVSFDKIATQPARLHGAAGRPQRGARGAAAAVRAHRDLARRDLRVPRLHAPEAAEVPAAHRPDRRRPVLEGAVIFEADADLPGALPRAIEPQQRRARLLRAQRGAARSSRPTASTSTWCRPASRTTGAPARCAACTSPGRRRARASWCAASAAPSTT